MLPGEFHSHSGSAPGRHASKRAAGGCGQACCQTSPALRIIGASVVTRGGKSLYYKGHLASRHGFGRCFAGSTWAPADVRPATCHMAVTEGPHRVFEDLQGPPGRPCFSRACSARSGFALILRPRIGGETRLRGCRRRRPCGPAHIAGGDATPVAWASVRRGHGRGGARRPARRPRNGTNPAQCVTAPWRGAAPRQALVAKTPQRLSSLGPMSDLKYIRGITDLSSLHKGNHE